MFHLFVVAQLAHGIRKFEIHWGIFFIIRLSIWRTPWLSVSVPWLSSITFNLLYAPCLLLILCRASYSILCFIKFVSYFSIHCCICFVSCLSFHFFIVVFVSPHLFFPFILHCRIHFNLSSTHYIIIWHHICFALPFSSYFFVVVFVTRHPFFLGISWRPSKKVIPQQIKYHLF